MSIINTMLNDLDTRLERQHDSARVALDGLSVAEPQLARRTTLPYSMMVLIGLLLLLAGLMLTGGAQVASKTIDSASSTSPMISLDEVSSPAVLESSLRPVGRVEGDEPESLAPVNDSVLAPGGQAGGELKLALWLGTHSKPYPKDTSLTAAIDALPSTPTLDVIRTSGNHDNASIGLILNGNPGYLLYTLQNPARAVIELEHTLLSADLPTLHDTESLLAGVRARQLADGSLRVIFDLHHPADIRSADTADEDGFKVLVINLTAKSNAIPAERGPPDGAATTPLSAQSRIAAGNTVNHRESLSDTTELVSAHALTKVVSQSSTDYYTQAMELTEVGHVDKAEVALRTVLASEPTHADARMMLVSSLVRQTRTGEALGILKEGLRISPGEPKLANLYAELLVRVGQLDLALTTLQGAAPGLAIDPAYHAFMAGLNQRLGEHRSAVETYQNVLRHAPENAVWWMGLAISLEALDEHTEAVKAYQRALQAQSLPQDLQRYVGQRLSALKRPSSS